MLSQLKLEVTQAIERQPDPIVLRFTELVACRNIQVADAEMPRLEAVLKSLKEKP